MTMAREVDIGFLAAPVVRTDGEPNPRPRRLRRGGARRGMLAETRLDVRQLIHPLFVRAGRSVERPIDSMPGHAQRSVDRLAAEIDDLGALRLPAVLLFGLPSSKDETGSGAWDASGPVPPAIESIQRRAKDLVVIADVCLCEYTSHGHCGILDPATGAVV